MRTLCWMGLLAKLMLTGLVAGVVLGLSRRCDGVRHGCARPVGAGTRVRSGSVGDRDAAESGAAVHRTIMLVDVECFGAAGRSDRHQLAVRAGTYAALRRAFEQTGIPWQRCDREDRGDGVFLLVPPDIAKAPFVDELPARLSSALWAHNRDHPPEEQIRLRMALHAGEVRYDEHGATATAINLAFRLLDSAGLKTALRRSSGTLAVIVSPWFFDEVVRHSTVGTSFRSVRVAQKETITTGWISLPDGEHATASAVPPWRPADQSA